MENKSKKRLDKFQTSLSMFAAAAAVAGITLLIYKLCGYPYLFESVMAFSLGFILFGMRQILDTYNSTADILVEYIGTSQAAINLAQTQAQTYAKHQQQKSDAKIIIDGAVDGTPFKDLGNLTEEQIEAIKAQLPDFLHGAFDTMNPKASTEEGNGNAKAHPEKNVRDMSINELYIAQKDAVDNDQFEEAGKLKKEIERRQGKGKI